MPNEEITGTGEAMPDGMEIPPPTPRKQRPRSWHGLSNKAIYASIQQEKYDAIENDPEYWAHYYANH